MDVFIDFDSLRPDFAENSSKWSSQPNDRNLVSSEMLRENRYYVVRERSDVTSPRESHRACHAGAVRSMSIPSFILGPESHNDVLPEPTAVGTGRLGCGMVNSTRKTTEKFPFG